RTTLRSCVRLPAMRVFPQPASPPPTNALAMRSQRGMLTPTIRLRMSRLLSMGARAVHATCLGRGMRARERAYRFRGSGAETADRSERSRARRARALGAVALDAHLERCRLAGLGGHVHARLALDQLLVEREALVAEARERVGAELATQDHEELAFLLVARVMAELLLEHGELGVEAFVVD